MQRRKFLASAAKNALLLGGAIGLPPTSAKFLTLDNLPEKQGNTDDLITDETYWSAIRNFFEMPAGYINLENGYFSPQPISTLYYHQARENYINQYTSKYMRTEQQEAIENARKSLADFLGADAEELALTRNTTESFNALIAGYPWKKGDEVVIGDQDYGSMVAAYEQAVRRHKIRIRVAKIPLTPQKDEEVVAAYSRLFTRKTKLVHITHLINLTGQVVPVARIAEVAKSRGIEVAVDAAHSVAQLEFRIPELRADYVGASLHKWLCNPLGAGFLWMKKEHIEKIWPLMADNDLPKKDIRKFEHQGTRPIQTLETIPKAIAFHQQIGGDLKEKRLKYLMQTWCKELHEKPGIAILTPWKINSRNSAIATVAMKGYTPNHLAKTLMERHKIFTVAINHPVVNGIRITPHIFTSKSDVEALVRAMQQI